MKINPLKQLGALGQSIWLDDIRRDLMTSGDLTRLIEDDGLKGMTSNPAIFEKAIVDSHDYDEAIRAMKQQGMAADSIYESLSQQDVQAAADAFRPLYDRTEGVDGYVSLEVNPHLAHNTAGTLAEARRLWQALNRPNVLIKVPSTVEGLPVIRKLIAEGINVNVTLIFSQARCQQVAEAFISGLEDRVSQGLPLERVASVASFFISRIDALVDPLLEKLSGEHELAQRAQGQVAIASAKMAYQDYKQRFDSERFKVLSAQGAQRQRLLWASTGTKNKAYSDIKYIDALIGIDTVNTAPPGTLEAYRDHGAPEARLEKSVAEAAHILKHLPEIGIYIEPLMQQLEDEGVAKFIQPFDQLMATLERADV